jgi:hypothetical protein
MKNNLPFFGHDSDALSHPKMQALVAEYGMAGYGMFWALNEFIAHSEEANLNVSKKVNKLSLANRMMMKPAELDLFLGFLADPEIDLINYVDGIITTDRVTENYRMVKAKREADRIRKSSKKVAIEEEEEQQVLYEDYLSEAKDDFSARKNEESKAEQKRVNNKAATAATATAICKNRLPEDTLEFEPVAPTRSLPDFEVIKAETKRIGIKFDNLSIQKIAQSGIPENYIKGCEGKYTFFEFTLQTIKRKYKDDQIRNLSGMFLMAVTSWDDLREQYPAWFEEQVKKERKIKAAHTREKAMFNKPNKCACGNTDMHQDSNGDIWCKECRSYYTFNNETLGYDFTDMREKLNRQQNLDFSDWINKKRL